MAAESRFQVGTNTTPKCPDVSQVSFVTSSVPSVSAGWLPHRSAGRERGGEEGGRAGGGGGGGESPGETGGGGGGAAQARAAGTWAPDTGALGWVCRCVGTTPPSMSGAW